MESLKMSFSLETRKLVRLCSNKGCDNIAQPKTNIRHTCKMETLAEANVKDEEYIKQQIKDKKKDYNMPAYVTEMLERYFDYCDDCAKHIQDEEHEEENDLLFNKIKKCLPNAKVFFDIDYTDKEEAKKLGFRWDNKKRKWYISPKNTKLELILKKWSFDEINEPEEEEEKPKFVSNTKKMFK